MPETIHFIITGGTVDSFYDGSKDTAVVLEHSCLPSFIRSLRLHCRTEFTEVCMKDSRALNKSDLKNILTAVKESPHKKIIITHGTYTMADTARYLTENLKHTDKTIVFTGSMVPLTGFSPSDGPFNIGYSIAKLQVLKPGIYVCMNGAVFSPPEVVKLLSEGRFVSILGEKGKA